MVHVLKVKSLDTEAAMKDNGTYELSGPPPITGTWRNYSIICPEYSKSTSRICKGVPLNDVNMYGQRQVPECEQAEIVSSTTPCSGNLLPNMHTREQPSPHAFLDTAQVPSTCWLWRWMGRSPLQRRHRNYWWTRTGVRMLAWLHRLPGTPF